MRLSASPSVSKAGRFFILLIHEIMLLLISNTCRLARYSRPDNDSILLLLSYRTSSFLNDLNPVISVSLLLLRSRTLRLGQRRFSILSMWLNARLSSRRLMSQSMCSIFLISLLPRSSFLRLEHDFMANDIHSISRWIAFSSVILSREAALDSRSMTASVRLGAGSFFSSWVGSLG